MRNKYIISILLILPPLLFSCQKVSYDFLIRGATIVDGSKQPAYIADVALRGDSIVKISKKIRGKASEIIEAQGRILTPGFIDMHTHCDWGMDQDITRANLNYLIQGVTSVVTGNCGYGSGNLDLFKKRFESAGIGNNMIPLTGFGWLRETVLGNEDRAPNTTELLKMKELFKQSLDGGSWGLSSGLQYVPEKYSTTEEIVEIAKIMSPYKRLYTTHMRSEEDELVEATEEAIHIASQAKIPLNIAHLKANGRKNWKSIEDVFIRVEEAQKKGLQVTADMYPYDKSSTSPLYTVLLYPDNLQIKSISDVQSALSDPHTREQIRELTETGIEGQTNWVAKGGWNYFSIVDAPKNPNALNKMFIDLAEDEGSTPFDIAANLVISEGEAIIISMSTMLEENLVKQMKKDWVMFSSDGSAISADAKGVHPRNFGSQARVLRKYVREENRIGLENAVYKMTGLPAATLGLQRKGLIKKGYSADLVLFHLDNIEDLATYLDPHQYAEGIDYVWVNGAMAISKSEFQNVYNGRVLLAK